MDNFKLNITESAKEKIIDVLAEENNPDAKVRISVQGGGCAGFSYQFSLSDDFDNDDFLLNIDDAKLVVDMMSAHYLNNATVDYKDEFFSKHFTVDNPNAETSCGCGSSFSLKM